MDNALWKNLDESSFVSRPIDLSDEKQKSFKIRSVKYVELIYTEFLFSYTK